MTLLNNKMIAIGSDHGGIELKEQMIEHLEKRGIECKDVGCYSPFSSFCFILFIILSAAISTRCCSCSKHTLYSSIPFPYGSCTSSSGSPQNSHNDSNW